jgi:hypothetical protein
MGVVVAQSYLLSLLDGLPLPYGQPDARAFITPPDPRIQTAIPAIYIWPADGEENRSPELGGTVPRNTGVGTSSGTKGILHRMDIYLTWTSGGQGTQQDPVFPGMLDAIMFALRFSQPNPVYITDPNTNLTSTLYNTGEQQTYRTGVESLADQRRKRYDALVTVSVWEIFNALSRECVAVTYYGHVTMTYMDYIDLATGKTLVCAPGQTYNIMPASGNPRSAGTTMPNDGRFTATAGISGELEDHNEPDENPEDEAGRGVTTQDTLTPEAEE